MHRAMTAVELDGLHRYWLDGRELDGCTSTLRSVGLIDSSRYTAEARQGRAQEPETRSDMGASCAQCRVRADRSNAARAT